MKPRVEGGGLMHRDWLVMLTACALGCFWTLLVRAIAHWVGVTPSLQFLAFLAVGVTGFAILTLCFFRGSGDN